MFIRRMLWGIALRNWILAVLVGLGIGFLARALSPDEGDESNDLVFGVAGALVGNLILTLSRRGVPGISLLMVFLAQVFGSAILILIGRLLSSGGGETNN